MYSSPSYFGKMRFLIALQVLAVAALAPDVDAGKPLASAARSCIWVGNACLPRQNQWYCPTCIGGGIHYYEPNYYCVPPFVLYQRHYCLPPNDLRLQECLYCGCCAMGGIIGGDTCIGLICLRTQFLALALQKKTSYNADDTYEEDLVI